MVLFAECSYITCKNRKEKQSILYTERETNVRERDMSSGGFTAETRGDRNEKLPCAMSSPVLSNM